MRKDCLFAMSLDGYIADKSGSVAWLGGHGGPEEPLDTYPELLRQVDTVILGWNTYRQIVTELSPGRWVYEQLTSYVITHRTLPDLSNIRFVQKDPCALVERLRRMPGGGIWICGGAGIIQPLVRGGLIDEYRISVIPTLLGDGIRLFEPTEQAARLHLERVLSAGGIAELTYTVRYPAAPETAPDKECQKNKGAHAP